MFKRNKKKTGCETPKYSRFSMAPNLNLGWQPTKSSGTKPPKPPTSGSNAVKPNPNYVPLASVAKTRTMVCHMKLEDLNKWVETTAQIGDIAYCHDHMTDNHYVYCFNNPDRNPVWYRILPEYLEYLQKEKDKGDREMIGAINCNYETPCGWCTKWDKKCDKKIGCEKLDEPHKQPPIKNKISDTPKQEPHFPECPSCGRYLNLLGGNPIETYLVCKFCNKSYVLNVFTEKLTLQEDN